METMKVNFEEFFEKHNAKIQITLFVTSLAIGAYFNICQENQLGIIIGLLLLIVGELVSLSIKDSITQRKLNNLGVKFEISRGALFRVHNFDLKLFFENTAKHFFVSGMALNGFFKNSRSYIENFLKEGKEVFILILAPDSVAENTKLYHGINWDDKTFKEKVNDILHKQIITLNYIEEIENIFDYIENGKLQLKITSSIMSTSFVAYDIFEKELLKKNKIGKELKASFYQYKCTDPVKEPNIVVDSFYSRDWYLFFKETIRKQWADAKIISTKQDFKALREKINNKINENNQ